jgi:hypothetical protein
VRSWHPIEVLHFSLRSLGQLERKARGGWLRSSDYHAPPHRLLLDRAYRRGALADYFMTFVIDDERLARGLVDGSLALDTRLRDALRAIRDPDTGAFRLPGSVPPLCFPSSGIEEEAMYAGEAAVLEKIDSIVRAERRADAFETRLACLEQGSDPWLRSLRRRFERRPTLAGR